MVNSSLLDHVATESSSLTEGFQWVFEMITQKTLRRRKILHFKTTQVTGLNTTLSQSRRKNTFQFFPAGMNKVSYSIFKCKIKCQACSIWVHKKKKKKDSCLLFSWSSSSELVKSAEKYYWSGLVGIYWLCYCLFLALKCVTLQNIIQLILSFLV